MNTFYTQHSPLTDPGQYAHLFDALSEDRPALHQAINNILAHDYAWADVQAALDQYPVLKVHAPLFTWDWVTDQMVETTP